MRPCNLYSLGRRTSIANQQTKQVALLSGTGVPVTKRFVAEGEAYYTLTYRVRVEY